MSSGDSNGWFQRHVLDQLKTLKEDVGQLKTEQHTHHLKIYEKLAQHNTKLAIWGSIFAFLGAGTMTGLISYFQSISQAKASQETHRIQGEP